VLTLRVNRAASARIVAGTPLTFEIFLTGTAAGGSIRVGGLGAPWYRLITLEAAGGAAALPWPLVAVGPPRSTVYARDTQDRPIVTSLPARTAAMIQGLSAVHVVTLGVSPEDSARTPVGSYRLLARLSRPWWMFWSRHGTIVSAPVTIEVSSGGNGVDVRERRRETAAFYLAAGRHAEAQQSALAWLQAEPDSSDAYAILGEAREAQGDSIAAMDAYRRALRLRAPSREPPEYLEHRLSALMRKTRRMQ
jgi:hypothetical protein